MDELTERLAALPTEADPGTDGWPAIEARLQDRRRTGWLKVAAAVALFAAGASGGFLVRGTLEAPQPGSIDEALVLAAEVQRTGSEYVAALAAFAAVVDSLSVDVRSQGRDAAIATLFGAANELAALSGGADGWVIPVDFADASRVRF
jgi:hypothetical protein